MNLKNVTFCIEGCAIKPSGGQKVIFEYANMLSMNGVNVNIVFPSMNNLYQLPIPVKCRVALCKLLTDALHWWPNWFKLDENIKTITTQGYDARYFPDADIIVATGANTAKPVSNLPERCGKKFYFIQDFENWLMSDDEVLNTYNLNMTNITISNWLKEIVDSYSNTNSYLIQDGINTDIFNITNSKRVNHSIVFHYRSAENKGCKYALEVVKRLKEIYSDLVVEVISSEKKPKNIPKFCNYHLRIKPEEVSAINNKTEIFICTSIEEGFGLPGLEAMACGCAVVSTSYKGVLEYAIDGENALLSPVKDVDAMVENIVQLFENDDMRKKISKNGVETGKNRSLEKSAQKFKHVLISTLQQQNSKQ